MIRSDNRALNEARLCTIEPGFMENADGSCLISTGKTRVICTASIEETVPPFLRGSNQGWITAEYAMLPASTGQRKARDGMKKDSRGVEISRLIGRSLRQAVDMKKLGERTITLDCDVLQADGGTRTASITGAYVALCLAINKLIKSSLLQENPLIAQIAAISAGIVENKPMLDLCYIEDSSAMTDMNMVMNQRGEFIELQGTAEGKPFSNRDLNRILDLGRSGIRLLMKKQREALAEAGCFLVPKIQLVLASQNEHKIKEMKKLFGDCVDIISMKEAGFDGDIDENGLTFEKNATIKAETISRVTGLPVIADDSGLSVDALNGEPGVFSARYAGEHGNDTANNALLLEKMENHNDRACRFVCCMALALPGQDTIVVRGECLGKLLKEGRGEKGFGYDPLFLYENGKTFAEMSEDEKNEVSHRAAAAIKMKNIIMELFV